MWRMCKSCMRWYSIILISIHLIPSKNILVDIRHKKLWSKIYLPLSTCTPLASLSPPFSPPPTPPPPLQQSDLFQRCNFILRLSVTGQKHQNIGATIMKGWIPCGLPHSHESWWEVLSSPPAPHQPPPPPPLSSSSSHSERISWSSLPPSSFSSRLM